MARLIGLVVGMGVFIGWIALVGNPHVVETVIGLGMALIAGFWVYFKVRRTPKGSAKSPF